MNQGDKLKKQFGARIKSLRENRELTQEKLAELADMNAIYLSNIERGNENPTLNLLIKISIALEVEMWELFDFQHEVGLKALRDILKGFANETADEEKLRTAVRVIRAVMR